MAHSRLVVVTGAVRSTHLFQETTYIVALTDIEQNRGIGKAICQTILSQQQGTPLKLFAASRKGEQLSFDSTDSSHAIEYPKLDVSSPDSVHAFIDTLGSHGQVDVLINNAGVNLDAQYGPETAKQTLDVNFRGTQRVCLPLVHFSVFLVDGLTFGVGKRCAKL